MSISIIAEQDRVVEHFVTIAMHESHRDWLRVPSRGFWGWHPRYDWMSTAACREQIRGIPSLAARPDRLLVSIFQVLSGAAVAQTLTRSASR